ncbi:hypothetical protein IU500_03155 [Nocardia terpenica]|uniref:hypothetical protein n=1 Tax=Nocardia terpenica TaxID=455432 RepID=UPI00189557C1|nr:hypothetical protein [Nocardia terpenica]MBF6059422.1 hypothetical protein [Nocardia terpenica]MBF6103039.1 hypothetical protein [Nocardia terpenica]MBF6110772.1 hypothetical protein [Nocardia terpenica]MBF6116903.1 hypothetical protein [Nocardia terpenica]MBF6151259.1 hypothetical protein [Nocardia terpenica]
MGRDRSQHHGKQSECENGDEDDAVPIGHRPEFDDMRDQQHDRPDDHHHTPGQQPGQQQNPADDQQ